VDVVIGNDRVIHLPRQSINRSEIILVQLFGQLNVKREAIRQIAGWNGQSLLRSQAATIVKANVM
jgi:hypothetical protein